MYRQESHVRTAWDGQDGAARVGQSKQDIWDWSAGPGQIGQRMVRTWQQEQDSRTMAWIGQPGQDSWVSTTGEDCVDETARTTKTGQQRVDWTARSWKHG
jgi:hypothetical protein